MVYHLKKRNNKRRISLYDICGIGKIEIGIVYRIKEVDVVDLNGRDFLVSFCYRHTVELTLVQLVAASFLKSFKYLLGFDISCNKPDVGIYL